MVKRLAGVIALSELTVVAAYRQFNDGIEFLLVFVVVIGLTALASSKIVVDHYHPSGG